ncbi:MAG TPA: ABC transporter permease [Hypericibacter adhaerens]|jgi:peptide/nickel transport system permease protein|uniref:Glutathione ABC transporter permease n=1 Tax=Hypericibacter adhaerens TaxID=2602016 RepID=A0A5J6N788_9PROT|nr:ABC transporter permease [Hypericibacter adhaerens]QEX24885.1 glutathione ABC transporter permease [Hypericibacter adhaerens]HWA45774.1 ABC transporter permease [Hypericibacter adhaerens]
MWGYLSRRLLASLAILIGITIVTFGLTFIIPADPVRMIAGRNASAQTVENIRQQLGLDRPLPEQYARYLMRLAQGDLGRSYVQKTQVSELVLSRLPATLLLMAGAIFFELLIGIPAGILAATRRGSPLDRWIMMASFAGVSAPQFVVGLLLLYLFANLLGLFPMGGFGTLGHLVLPALTLGIGGGGWYARMMRSSMVDVLRQDYVRTAKAKGLGPAKVVLVHALRNAVLPIVAMVGLDVGIFMSGAVVVESVYGWPGIGQLAWMGIQRIDIPIIMGVTLVAALGILIGNLVADLITPLIDPRIRLR